MDMIKFLISDLTPDSPTSVVIDIASVLLLTLLTAAALQPTQAAACNGAAQAELGMCAEARQVAADKRVNEAYG